MSGHVIEISSVLVFFIGFYGVIASNSIIKTIVSTSIMEIAVVLFFLSIGFFEGVAPPIGQDLAKVADPLPQALVITAIIMGVAVTAVNLTMLISLCTKNKTADWSELKRIRVE